MDKLFFTEEHEMLKNMVRDFAENEVEPLAREMDEKETIPKDLIDKMGKLGIMGIPVPEKYGGAGMDTVAYATAIMELAKVDASVAITVAAHTSLGTMPIVLAGTEEQKMKYCAAKGKMKCCKFVPDFGVTAGVNQVGKYFVDVKLGHGFSGRVILKVVEEK